LKKYLFDLDYNSLCELKHFDSKFRIKQIVDFVFKKLEFDINKMTSLPIDLRKKIDDLFFINNLTVEKKYISEDGTIKYLFRLEDGNFVESVSLSDINNRKTFCISTQVGCRMGCTFCKTGKIGFIRDMTPDEIVSQVILLHKYSISDQDDKSRFNIVLMGMGEPLDNISNLKKGLSIITGKEFFGLSQDRITLSTCGVVDRIDDFFDEFPGVNLAVSLNSNINDKRKQTMPITNKHSIEQIVKAVKNYTQKYKKRVTLEYVLIKSFNNGEDELAGFVKNFKGLDVLINLIPLNHSDDKSAPPSNNEIMEFKTKLEKSGFTVTRRYRRGSDINADCGQLYGSYKSGQICL